MAERLLKYYKLVAEEKGLAGKVELAKMTKVPSNQAAMVPDSPENLKMFMEAVKKVTGKAAPIY